MQTKQFLRPAALCALVVLLFTLGGCGGGDNHPVIGSSFSAKDDIKIEDIDWTVTESVMDGVRFISFNYTNNSPYTILDMEIKFVQKAEITSEQRCVFDDLKAEWEWTKEDVEKIYILGYNRKCADPGETVSDSPCVINGTHILVESMAQYEIMEPDMATIAFIGPDGKGYGVYYDFKTESYGEPSNAALDLQQWSDSEMSRLLPKAEFRAVTIGSDDEDRFCFSAYGVSKGEFDAYVKAVKAKGFTIVGFESSTNYRASNTDGMEADITYNAVQETMTGCVEPE